jgi:hypothetical protein
MGVKTTPSMRRRFFCLGEVSWILLWPRRRLREDPLKGLPEELRLRWRMFRERLRKGLLEASRKRLQEALREGLQKEPRNGLPEELRGRLRHPAISESVKPTILTFSTLRTTILSHFF